MILFVLCLLLAMIEVVVQVSACRVSIYTYQIRAANLYVAALGMVRAVEAEAVLRVAFVSFSCVDKILRQYGAFTAKGILTGVGEGEEPVFRGNAIGNPRCVGWEVGVETLLAVYRAVWPVGPAGIVVIRRGLHTVDVGLLGHPEMNGHGAALVDVFASL